jgi:membrane-bound metal-dependent hydrolase YbcI (DUF457 family)
MVARGEVPLRPPACVAQALPGRVGLRRVRGLPTVPLALVAAGGGLMLWDTHIAAGAGSWVAVSALTGPPRPLCLAGGCGVAAVAALLPDLDSKSAKASRYVPVLSPLASWLVRRRTTHRKGLHTIWAAGVLAAALMVAIIWLPVPWWAVGAAALGYGSHIVADGFTSAPIFPLWPWIRRPLWLAWPAALRVRTGSRAELVVQGIVAGLAGVAVWRGWLS